MKITNIGAPKIIMSNPRSKHNYFAWPTVARLQNGKIAVVASGFRFQHVCPFGKTVISYSEDEAQTYTAPAPIIDTVLDDRDGGITPFGERGVMVTSFNNTFGFQRNCSQKLDAASKAYYNAYMDIPTAEEEEKYLGALFCFSNDCGVTFGELYKSPITSPHGPLVLPDGTLLWVGRTFVPNGKPPAEIDRIEAHKVNLDGTTEFVGHIENVQDNGQTLLSCEPHAILLDDGRILCHIRVQRYGKDRIFTVYQSESDDNGKTWSTPHCILGRTGGSPSHILRHSSGTLVGTYGYREGPYGIKAMFSHDNGKTWDIDHEIYMDGANWDLGYPSSIELKDGSILTVFYTRETKDSPAVIMQQIWRFENNEI